MTKKEIFILLKHIIKNKDRKSFTHISKDLIELKKKNSLNEMRYYFATLMYRRDSGNIHMYVNDSVLFRILRFNSKQGNWYDVANKLRFIEKMKEIPNSTPLYLGKIEKGIMYDNRQNIINIDTKNNFLEAFNNIIGIHKVIFVKSAESSSGKGVFRFNELTPPDLDKLNLENDYLIEKGLAQHEALIKINSSCINTLRVITYNRNGEVKIPSCALRMGLNKSHNDNISTGGIFTGYNIEKNKLDEVALDKWGTSYYSHPETHYVFKDQALPYPEKVISLVKEAAEIFSDRYVIGWDVAYTPEGPVIIEGNTNPCPVGMQIALRGLRNVKIYDDIYREFYN
jgi:hypothetical protein